MCERNPSSHRGPAVCKPCTTTGTGTRRRKALETWAPASIFSERREAADVVSLEHSAPTAHASAEGGIYGSDRSGLIGEQQRKALARCPCTAISGHRLDASATIVQLRLRLLPMAQ